MDHLWKFLIERVVGTLNQLRCIMKQLKKTFTISSGTGFVIWIRIIYATNANCMLMAESQLKISLTIDFITPSTLYSWRVPQINRVRLHLGMTTGITFLLPLLRLPGKKKPVNSWMFTYFTSLTSKLSAKTWRFLIPFQLPTLPETNRVYPKKNMMVGKRWNFLLGMEIVISKFDINDILIIPYPINYIQSWKTTMAPFFAQLKRRHQQTLLQVFHRDGTWTPRRLRTWFM